MYAFFGYSKGEKVNPVMPVVSVYVVTSLVMSSKHWHLWEYTFKIKVNNNLS